tara:strand:+ start:228 stop:488 length:261 start_codon:yes stop_codon:yes gene_type:complete
MAPTKSAKGALGELRLAVEYMNKGYWVALSIDPQCPFDMVVVDKNGKCTLVDAKCISIRKKGRKIYRMLKTKQKKMGVILRDVDCN